jgi:ParB family transcriptional regulator, chromosome partitioning protein
MSKREMLEANLGNIDESLGNFDRSTARGAAAGPRALPANLVGVVRSKDCSMIAVDRIDRDPSQPRTSFDQDGLDRLADSLRRKGQLQPIQVRWDEGRGKYVVLTGERRWRAARIAGLETLMCMVRDKPLTDEERLSIQMVENALREDLSPTDQAKAYKTLMEANGWGVERVAEELSISHSQVVRAMSILSLPESVQEHVEQGRLPGSTAYEISKLDDPEAQRRLADDVVNHGLTRNDAVKHVRAAASQSKPAQIRARGGGKPKRKVQTIRSLRAAGFKITIENRKGVDAEPAIDALREAIQILESELMRSASEAA